jgi:hypothetical protein
MSAETSRTCPFCAEPIPPAAKVCPRCRQWLTIWSVRNPLVTSLVAGLLMATIMVVLGATALNRLDRVINPQPNHTTFPHALRVLESRMNWAQTKDGLRIYLTGILTNQSPIPWQDIEFESRFYDSAGLMVDAAHSHGYLTIQPCDDTAFRAVVIPGCATNVYSSYKLSVSMARNGWSRF